MSGIVIAGTHSGCGKTLLTLGLAAAFKKKGMSVGSFKAGPDFIDSGLHRIITGRSSRNLDLWMCGENYVRDLYSTYASQVDIAIVEGVMGLFDGELSTAQLAECLDLPVILVIDSYGMAETAGAVVRGFAQYASDNGIDLAGVIFNRVASERHYARLCADDSVRVFGYLPRDLEFEIPHRHLGLVVAEENPISRKSLDKLADAVLKYTDTDMIAAAAGITDLSEEERLSSCANRNDARESRSEGVSSTQIATQSYSPVAAIACDNAFCFYYEDNLDLLRGAGLRIVYFSPLSDRTIPEEADIIYIGGGYPELYAEGLSKNLSMLDSIREWADSGKPLYAECGGLMYLSRGIHDFGGNFYGMSGVFPFETRMKQGRSRLGYRQVSLKADCILGHKGDILRGHEFHYSQIQGRAEEQGSGAALRNFGHLYSVQNGSGERLDNEGYQYKRTLGSYIHMHFGSNPCVAEHFINCIKQSEQER